MSEVRWFPAVAGDVFSRQVRELADEQCGRRIDVLIAGCGQGIGLELDGVDARLVGVDEDLPPLRAITAARRDLATWSLSDLRSVPMPPRAFDVVYVTHLLERIPHTELVLDRMVAALRPGGLLLVRVRDRRSAYGYLDRTLPEWLRDPLWHRFAPPGAAGPLPAVYEPVTTRDGISSYCLTRGLVVVEERRERTGPALHGRHPRLARAACRVVAALSGGRLTAAHDELGLVIRKPQNHFARLV